MSTSTAGSAKTKTELKQALVELSQESRKAVDAEINAFHRLHAWLLEHHPGEFVAIYGQQLVDHDVEKSLLHKRIQEQYPNQFVLLRRVEKEPEPELHFRSTRCSAFAS